MAEIHRTFERCFSTVGLNEFAMSLMCVGARGENVSAARALLSRVAGIQSNRATFPVFYFLLFTFLFFCV